MHLHSPAPGLLDSRFIGRQVPFQVICPLCFEGAMSKPGNRTPPVCSRWTETEADDADSSWMHACMVISPSLEARHGFLAYLQKSIHHGTSAGRLGRGGFDRLIRSRTFLKTRVGPFSLSGVARLLGGLVQRLAYSLWVRVVVGSIAASPVFSGRDGRIPFRTPQSSNVRFTSASIFGFFKCPPSSNSLFNSSAIDSVVVLGASPPFRPLSSGLRQKARGVEKDWSRRGGPFGP